MGGFEKYTIVWGRPEEGVQVGWKGSMARDNCNTLHDKDFL